MSDDVTQWLQEHELGKYTEIFAHNDVAYGNQRLLTDEDLREIGLPVCRSAGLPRPSIPHQCSPFYTNTALHPVNAQL